MRNTKPLLLLTVLFITGCLFTKKHRSNVFGRYNEHDPLQLESADKWVQTVLTLTALKELEITITSEKWDHYYINDSVMFFGNHDELLNYHSYKTFAERLGVDSSILKSIVMDFDQLCLNRFYREKKYLAFKTESYFESSKGFFYFIDTSLVKEAGDTIDLRPLPNSGNFRDGMHHRFLVLNKINKNWVEWKQTY